MRELSVRTDSKIMLLIIDGLGGLPVEGSGGETELETASTPNLDALADRSDLGLSRPVAAGVSPGSGPGHLALFGYDPIRFLVGRGLLSALGVGFEVGENDLAARINFATKDPSGKISDRRGGRISSEKAAPLVDLLNESVSLDGVETFVTHEKEHRAVVVFRGEGLSDALADTDPQRTGLEPYPVKPTDDSPEAEKRVSGQRVRRAGERDSRGPSPGQHRALARLRDAPQSPLLRGGLRAGGRRDSELPDVQGPGPPRRDGGS
jgi:2,3-bisphosphoglycerate-independent phosphoglycerate mutase